MIGTYCTSAPERSQSPADRPRAWQPPPRFHDDHHAHFHVNYGQTLGLWDRLFGTWRRVGRVYGADVYGGKGAPLAADGAGAARYVDYRKRLTRQLF